MSSPSTATPPRRSAAAATVRAAIGDAHVPYGADTGATTWWTARSRPRGLEGQVSIAEIGWNCRVLNGAVDERTQRRQRAHRIGICRIACESKRLTAAPSEVDRLARTAATWFRHPLVAAIRSERRRLVPDPIERALPNVLEAQRRDAGRPMARQRLSVR